MFGAELKKIGLYTLFLAILLTPMLGFKTVDFDLNRVLSVLGVFVGILVLSSLAKGIKAGRKKVAREDTWTQRMGRKIASWPKIYTLGGVLLVAVVYPLVVQNYHIDVAITCLLYVTLALGLNIVVGLAGLLDLGFIAFYAVGAYTYSLLNLHFHVGFWTALPFGVILGMTCGCIIGYPTLKMRGDYLAIVTLGFGEIIRLVLNNWDKLTAGPNGLFGMKKPALYYPGMEDGSLTMVTYYLKSLPMLYYLLLLITILTIIGVSRLNNSRIGRAWIAIREDETAAELSGVNTTGLKLLAYAMGAGFASVAGSFFAAKLSYTNPNFFLFLESCIVLAMVCLGGLGSIPGVVIAAITLGALPEIFRELQDYRMLFFGAMMTMMMILKPEGLIPASRRKRELHQFEKPVPEEVEND